MSAATSQYPLRRDNPPAASDQQQSAGDSKVPQHKRVYQACIPCRRRKVKCDLGSVDNPGDPPCVRCRRESKECFFSATRRKRKTEDGGDGILLRATDNEPGDDVRDAHGNAGGFIFWAPGQCRRVPARGACPQGE